MGRASKAESRNRHIWRRAAPWWISFAILTLAATDGAAAETKRVLMLFSNDSLLPASNAIASSLQAAPWRPRIPIGSNSSPSSSMPTGFRGRRTRLRMESLLRDKYASIPIDLTIAIGPQALEFLSERRASLFPGTPLIFAGVSEAGLRQRGTPPNSTGVVSRFDPVRTLELALRLQPDARAGRRRDRRFDFRSAMGRRRPRAAGSLRRSPRR